MTGRVATRPRTVAVTGASGLIGRALTRSLTAGGHTVVRIGRGASEPTTSPRLRDPRLRDASWDPAAGRLDPRALDGVDAVVHLAGANVGARWTPEHRRAILDSRVQGTRLVAGTVAAMARPPRVLVSASGVGYYGDRGDAVLDERAARGRGFLADVCAAWEAAADPARAAGVRVVHPRFGAVLASEGGMLPALLPAFRVGAGGPFGGGRQWARVVALADVVGALQAAVAADALAGAVNVVLPEPVRNRDLAHALGRVLRRPAVVRLPAFAVRALLGRAQADETVLASQRAVPARLLAAGYAFRRPTLEDALRGALGR